MSRPSGHGRIRRRMGTAAVFCALLAMSMAGGGCASAVSAGSNTALDALDLVRMTDQMAAGLAADPDVQREIRQHGPLVVVVQPVVNLMTAAVLPKGQADAFTARVRVLLSKHAPDQFTWVMNRDAFYSLRNQELSVDLGPDPGRVQPQYALTATFRSLVHVARHYRSDYYLCTYELSDLRSGNILWRGQYDVKKTAVGGMLG